MPHREPTLAEPVPAPLLHVLPDPGTELIWLLGAEGTVEYVSPLAEELLGRSPQELVGSCVADLVHPEDAAEFRGFLEEAWVGRSQGLASRVLARGGEYLWLGSTARAVRDAEGRTTQLQVVSRDVTERKRAELALRRAEWLAGIGQAVLTLRHEINNPLTSMLADAALLEMGGNTPEEELEMVQSIVRQARRIRDVVHRLAERKDDPALRPAGPSQILDLSDSGS